MHICKSNACHAQKLELKKRGATSQCAATPHRSYTYFFRLFTGLGRIEDVHFSFLFFWSEEGADSLCAKLGATSI